MANVLRILIYTDFAAINEEPTSSWGLTDLERFVTAKLRFNDIFDVVDIRLKNRHWDYENNKEVNGINRITDLNDTDELWIFGYQQQNTSGAPHNELDAEEVDVIKRWMDEKGGGVLITGDHSNPPPGGTCRDDHKTFLNLGRALGHCIPRARHLRVWEGPPTACMGGDLNQRDNYNTIELKDAHPCDLDDPNAERDEFAQTILPLPPCPPHFLFHRFPLGSTVLKPILKFPDHPHEGRVCVPECLDDDWPEHSPFPKVVAKARDKRFPDENRLYDLVVAYDGDDVGVGRIVADSSFHHYFNANLRNIPSRSENLPVPDSDLDQIARFYANMAIWLAPKEIRNKMKLDLCFRLAKHPDVLQVKANDALIVGKTARTVATKELHPMTVSVFLPLSQLEASPSLLDHAISYLFLGESGLTEASLLGPELILGEIIRWYHSYFDSHGITNPGWLDENPAGLEIILGSFLRVHDGFRELYEASST
jgi:hypothetical protein